jgi:pyruvate dehydrogenase E2 component (dihydrolipoamide acetyltransferase)
MPKTILMPALSAGMEEGTIARWTKAAGDTVAKGDVIVEIETDKATMEYEAEDDGVLGTIVAGDGATVPVNAAIAVLLLAGEDAAAPVAVAAPVTVKPTPEPEVASRKEAASPAHGRAERIAASPLARRIARERGISIAGLTGSGARGRIVRVDVEKAGQTATAAPVAAVAPPVAQPVVQRPPQPRPDAPYREAPNSGVRKVIARRLSEAKATIPHFYLNASCEIDALLALRAQLNAAAPHKLSINDFIIKAAAIALRQVPEANAAWTDEAILLFDDVDIAVAVATDGGLITPIVRQADRKGLAAISSDVRQLAERARDGKLQPADYQGGGFTISNLGMYGVESFSAIINPPQSCILAVGAAERRPVIRDDVCVPATIMQCTLSVDHRSVDGAVGARWLAAFKSLVEQPLQLML